MPLYDYECTKCHEQFERILPVSECDDIQFCPECGVISDKIVSLGHGGIWRKGDSLPWVRDVAKVLTDNDRPNPNINTVDDLRNYYDTHPNVRPKESHPALPSSYGDSADKGKVDHELKRVQRSRKANEYLRNLRSIEVNSRAGQSA